MRLKELRLKAKKTQKEIAEILNMSQTGYNSYEIERTMPDIEVLKKLSRYYNETIDYIVDNEFYYSVTNKTLSPIQEETIEEIKKSNDTKCEFILNFIKELTAYEDLTKSERQLNDFEKKQEEDQ